MGNQETRALTQTIIRRKFAVPSLPNYHLPRPRLIEKLMDRWDAGGSTALIIGGPGCGKTTFLAEMARQTSGRTMWYALSASERDPASFFGHLIAGMRTFHDEVGHEAADLVRTGRADAIAQAMGLLCDDVAMAITEPLYVIIDNTQELRLDPSMATGLEALLRFLPEQVRLVFSGRVALPVHVAQFRLRGQLFEVIEEDLRFTESEIAQYCNNLWGLTADSAIVAQLERRTRGWVAAVVHVTSAGPEKLPGRMERPGIVYDDVAEEILASLPESQQDDLLLCALAPKLTAKVVQALFGIKSESVIAWLSSFSMFVSKDDDEVVIHSVFRESLERLTATRWTEERLSLVATEYWRPKPALSGDRAAWTCGTFALGRPV